MRDAKVASTPLSTIVPGGGSSPLGTVPPTGTKGYADVLLVSGTHIPHVLLGQNFFQDLDPAAQMATMIHEALHVALNLDDTRLSQWLIDHAGYQPAPNARSGAMSEFIEKNCGKQP